MPMCQRLSNSKKAGIKLLMGAMVFASGLLVAHQASSQTTNALDYASDPAYAGDGPPNGLSPGGQNGGTGFGPWTFTVNNSGGAFLQNNGPSGNSFDLWNNSFNANTFAIRPFNSPLSAGQSFSVQLRLNSLDGTANTNMLALEDTNGNILFSYYHLGGDNANGHYTDANTTSGTAVNFPYDYQKFDSFTFTLNNATSYTFTDNTSGASISGIISGGPIAQVAFIRGNGQESPGNGQDFQFDALQITAAAGSSAPPSFANPSPAPGSFSVLPAALISVQVIPGSFAVNTNGVTMTVDNTSVTALVTNGGGGALNVSYQPSFTAGTKHVVQVVAVDSNHNSYTNAWSFTTSFATLPAVLAGPITISNGVDATIFTAAGDAWLGTNYQAGSSLTVYARASMDVINNAGETGNGGFFCGFHFFEGNTERLIFGNNWGSLNWSVDTIQGGSFDLTPVTPIVLDEWHTLVARVDFVPGQNANVKVWLDPDFTKTETDQTNAPFETSMLNTFDNIRLRCGNGATAITEYSNVIVAATSSGVGFAAPANPQFHGLVPAPGAVDVATTTSINGQVTAGGSPINSNTVVLRVDGNVVSPTVTSAGGVISINYSPASHLSDGTTHVAQIIVIDNNNSSFTNTWNFTTAFASLPAVLTGPLHTSNQVDVVLFSTNDAWVGANYDSTSSKTLYVSFAMEFDSTNDTGSIYTWGGIDFYQDNNEKLLVGKNGDTPNWSVAYAGANYGDLPPGILVATHEWHKFVARFDYSPGANATASVWFDPDLTQPELSQPVSPVTLNIDATFNNIRLRCGFSDASDTVSNVVVSSSSPFSRGGPTTFQDFVPGQNANSAPVGSPVSVQVVFGTYDIITNNITMNLDGTNVTPKFTVTPSAITVQFQPATPFAPGSFHTVTVNATDSSATPYSTSWSFTADLYPSLPLTQAGPFAPSPGADIILYNSQNGWIGGNYAGNFTGTLYTRFSMTFLDLNGETGQGGAFGGLEFYQGNTERLLVGNSWVSTNWSTAANGQLPDADFLPVTPIVLGEWHTLLIKSVYAGTTDAVKVWLDPDFTKQENNQPNPPISFTMNNTFDNIRLRIGNGTAQAEFTNIVFAATPEGVGLPPGAGMLSLGKVNSNLQLSWTGSGTLQAAPAVSGPWTTTANQSNPQTIAPTNSAMFFRLR